MQIQSVLFNDALIEVSYSELRDLDESGVLEIRTLAIPIDLVEDELAEVMDSLQQLVDSANLARRNPPKRIKR